jgi:hypothetical protein
MKKANPTVRGAELRDQILCAMRRGKPMSTHDIESAVGFGHGKLGDPVLNELKRMKVEQLVRGTKSGTGQFDRWTWLIRTKGAAKRNPMSVKLPHEEADRTGSNDGVDYLPKEGDWRQLIERQIRERRGQRPFRDALRKRYGDRCLVTGCEVLAVLEAAHIKPYRGEDDNHPENGLLLRADIHTLFDLDLIGIEPDRLQVELHPDLADDKEYAKLAGKTLGCGRERQPSQNALKLRYEQFQQRRE